MSDDLTRSGKSILQNATVTRKLKYGTTTIYDATTGYPGTKKVAKVALAGATVHAGVQAWTNPEAGAIVVNRVTLDVTTVATAAGTIEIGTTATNATTASATLIDTLDVHTATGTFDNLANPGAGGKMLQKLAAGKWVTFAEASGNLTGLVATAYIEYVLV